jgi:hypothetical protein
MNDARQRRAGERAGHAEQRVNLAFGRDGALPLKQVPVVP